MIILVAEDELFIGITLCLVLRTAGYRVNGPAENFGRALVLAAAEPPDLAFVDINLEGHSEGLDLVRSLHFTYGTTCVFLTGQPKRAQEAASAALGLLSKPYNPIAAIQAAKYVAAVRLGGPRPMLPTALQLLA